MIGRVLLVVVIVGVLLGLSGAAYVVFETEQAIITQFGKPVGEPVTDPGLHFKIPIIRKVHRFDKRFLEWDGKANQLPTKDKRFIWVDTYARWRITDPLLFFQRLQNERGAQSRLDDILDGETRNAIAKYDVVEVVARQDWVLHGQVGMVGLSYPGISQLYVASTAPPSLAAVVPALLVEPNATSVAMSRSSSASRS